MGEGLEMVGNFDAAAVGIVGQQERSRFESMMQYARMNQRSIEGFRQRTLTLCTLNEDVAEQCLYALPRKGKDGNRIYIEGPSIRMAEILLKSWRNAGVFGMVIESGAEYVTAQATFIDFEDLTMVSKQVKRRVLGTHGDARMLAENAAISVATRNAILGAIPRALWEDAYQKAKQTAAGTMATLEAKRSEAMKFLADKHGISAERVFYALDVEGVNDIGLEELAMLRTLTRQVRDKEQTAAEAFPDPKAAAAEAAKAANPARGVAAVRAAVEGAGAANGGEGSGTSTGTAPGAATDGGGTLALGGEGAGVPEKAGAQSARERRGR